MRLVLVLFTFSPVLRMCPPLDVLSSTFRCRPRRFPMHPLIQVVPKGFCSSHRLLDIIIRPELKQGEARRSLQACQMGLPRPPHR